MKQGIFITACMLFVSAGTVHASAEDGLRFRLGESRIDIRWHIGLSGDDLTWESFYDIVDLVVRNDRHIAAAGEAHLFRVLRRGTWFIVDHESYGDGTRTSLAARSVEEALSRVFDVIRRAYEIPDTTSQRPGTIISVAVPAAVFGDVEPDIAEPHIYFGPAPGTMQHIYRGDLYLQYLYLDMGAFVDLLDRYPELYAIVTKRSIRHEDFVEILELDPPARE